MALHPDNDQETIIAQCTPQGAGALALLRLSGSQALEIADSFGKLASGQKISQVPTHTIHYGTIADTKGTTIDQVMFIVMHAPQTFTGQTCVEITCHNNPFIIENIIGLAIEKGARVAQPGEFTRRAVLNNKMDLVQAEALHELIHANTQMALKKSLSQLKGTFSSWIIRIEEELLKTLALSEASFEFIDDEITFGDQIRLAITHLIDEVHSLKKTFNQQQHIRQGFRVAIIGSVNAGKSSLFNTLLNKDRAIVTSIAGTTRDVLEAGVYRNGNYWTLIDTAGLRQSQDVIEQEGIKRSHHEAQAADVILLVIDSSRPLTEPESAVYNQLLEQYAHKTMVVYNKTDMASALTLSVPNHTPIKISTKTRDNIEQLEAEVEKKIAQILSGIESPFLLNQRQYNLLLGLEKKLIAIQSMLTGEPQYELVSYELKDALEQLSELSGKTISEQGMDAVFRQFCVGK